MILALGFLLTFTGVVALCTLALLDMTDLPINDRVMKGLIICGCGFVPGVVLMTLSGTIEIWRNSGMP